MKTVADVRTELDRKLNAHWHTWIAGAPATADAAAESRWPLAVVLGRPDRAGLKESFSSLNRDAISWRDLAAAQELQLRWANRVVSGTTQSLPTHVGLPDLDAAARLAEAGWPLRLQRARRRWQRLQERFGPAATAKELRYTDQLDDPTFETLLTAAEWFQRNDATGMTPRQVPLPGVHGKWLNQHHACLQALSGKPSLGLTSRPSRVLFRYLDPQHVAAGGRRYDSHTLGDASDIAYRPEIVVICENKDTALLFPDLQGGVSIFGNGDAASRQLPQLPWLAEVPVIYYWGDIDADGFECLHSLRAAGIRADSVLMDWATYETYEPYGSWTGPDDKPLTGTGGRELTNLTSSEANLYHRLVDPAWTRVRRIEQERIPLPAGLAATTAAAATGTRSMTVRDPEAAP